jgi:hypothetical protein
MEELIKKIEEAAYYYPGTYFADNMAHVYGEGMKAGRAQALRILRGEEPDA